MSAPEHENAFPPLKLSDCCRFGKPTSAGANGNENDAPIADLPFLLLVMESAEAEPFQSTGTRLA